MSFLTGFYVGTDPSALNAVNAWLGKPADVLNWQLDSTSWAKFTSSLSYTARMLAGVTTQVNYTVPLLAQGSSLADAAAHKFDSYYVQAAQALLATSGGQGKITVRVGEEFNGNWMPWAAGGHEADYAQAYRNFVDAFRSVSNKFVFEWNVAIGSTAANTAAAYPGDSYVDIVSGDLYWDTSKSWSIQDPTQAFNYYKNTTNGLAWLESFATAHGKPTAYSEWGVNSSNAAPFIDLVHDWFASHNVVYASYWDTNSSFAGKLSDGSYGATSAEFKALFGAVASAVTPPVQSGAPADTLAPVQPVVPVASGPSTAVTSPAVSVTPVVSDTVQTAPAHGLAPVTSDFDGNGSTDVIVRNAAGGFVVWSSGSHALASKLYSDVSVGAGWMPEQIADFDSNGFADIVWHKAGTTNYTIWSGHAGGFDANTSIINVSAGWSLAATADFNGDGKADLLWRNTNGSFTIWQSTGSGFQANSYMDNSVNPTWHIQATTDFNGDGKADILWRNDNGAFTVWDGATSGFVKNAYVNNTVSTDWHVATTGDFNGDGKADILWRNDNGHFSIWQGADAGFVQNAYLDNSVSPDWKIASVGDYNGDGITDILWSNVNNGITTEWLSNGHGFNANSATYATLAAGLSIVQTHYDIV